MIQRSFASAEYAMEKKRTRRERFLAEMERIVPWGRLIAAIEPLYPASGRVGCPPVGVSRMLRMYCLQQWYGLADEALEDALYDSQALRDFVGIDLPRESVPEAATLLEFRRLLLASDLTKALFDEITAHLAEQGLFMRAGTIVEATITAAANADDVRQAGAVLHGDEMAVHSLQRERDIARRNAQNLHDGLGQTLTAIRLYFDACRPFFPVGPATTGRLERLDELIAAGRHQVREALAELHPPRLDELGLTAALRHKLAKHGDANPDVRFELRLPAALEQQRWPPAVEYAAFMIAREALLNALQHGRPGVIEVHVLGGPRQLLLELIDDGIGLQDGAALKPGHMGLAGMRERALAIGAEVSVAARNQGGTSVSFLWPAHTAGAEP